MHNILHRYLQMDRKGRWVISFGKHEGCFLDDIVDQDPNYLEWFKSQKDVPQSVQDVIEVALGD